MLNARRLLMLSEVASRGSFAAAAAALNYTPSAVSQQMATLEREVGTTLIVRGPKGTSLTDAGRALARHGERILKELSDAESEMQILTGQGPAPLRLGWFATAGASLVPRAIAAFRAEQPSVEMIFIEADPSECAERVREGQLDIALVYEFEHGEKAPADLNLVPLLEDRIYVALPAGHRLAAEDEVPLGLLVNEPWVQGVRSGSMLEVLPAACLAAGFEPRIAFRTDEHMAVQGLVGAGVGIGLVPELCLPISRRDITLRPITAPVLARRVSALLTPSPYRPPAVRAMIETLVQVAEVLVEETRDYVRAGDAVEADDR